MSEDKKKAPPAAGSPEQAQAENVTFDMSGVLYAQKGHPYEPLAYDETGPDKGLVRRVAASLLNFFASKDLGWRQWQEGGTFELTYTAPGPTPQQVKSRLTFDAVCSHLESTRRLEPDVLGCPAPNQNWLDTTVALSVPAHAPINGKEAHVKYVLPSGVGVFAEAAPCLDREGVAYSNVLLALHSGIVRLRGRLVGSSRKLFELEGEWHDDLRSYLGACVSAVDATLSRVFLRAWHQGEQLKWRLNREKFPSARTVPRDKDMFRWLSAVTGHQVEDRHADYAAFDELRQVRNHLHHFDPPVFAMSIDDAARWLNLSRSVGSMLLSIRTGLGLPAALPLIELLLAPTVVAVAHAPKLRRFPQPKDAGYASCRKERPIA